MTQPTQATYLRTDTVPLRLLTPFPGNAKRGEVPVILDSLRRNGQYRGLVVREIPNGPLIVLAGNHTAQALDSHGRGPCSFTFTVDGEERPCGICHGEDWEPAARCEVYVCDDGTARRINLVDNKSADLGSYDRDALAELLSYLNEDYAGTGYTEGEVMGIVHALPPQDVDEEEFPAFDEDIPTQYCCPKCQYSWSGKPS
ncbi:hypothetical protein [Streptomyces sp. NBC_01207]|uniref:hypothetical protein n=1 Tax=Streptomyces sp. NBC_01207 TaxID=2903772 RepID=UPI002E10A439|nr:hypothetical protein OG457_27400 [Streptomyces sp. NBC_01207]